MKRVQLRVDPAKTAAFHARGRAKGLGRGNRPLRAGKGLARSTGFKRARPKVRLVTPPGVWAAVLTRDGGLCVWTRYLGHRAKAEHPHHLLPKGVDGWPQYAGTRENICGLSAQRHMAHEHSPRGRLPWDALPDECQAFLRTVCARDARAERFVRIKYLGAVL